MARVVFEAMEDKIGLAVAAEVARAEMKTIEFPKQFSAENLTLLLGCRVDEVELEHMVGRGDVSLVAAHIYQVKDAKLWDAWVHAKISQREFHRRPSPVREPSKEADVETAVAPRAPSNSRGYIVQTKGKSYVTSVPVPGDGILSVIEGDPWLRVKDAVEDAERRGERLLSEQVLTMLVS